MAHVIDFGDVQAAAERVAPHVHRTPVATCATLDRLTHRRLFFKCEHLQRAGAFKIRGATNAISILDASVTDVVTHSSGNHAQAVALAARATGRRAHVVMPETSLVPKLEAVRGYGARVVLCAPTMDAREEKAQEVLEETGGTLIHPYDHGPTIAGQGTVGLELLDQVMDLDAIIAPVGGGGLISGIATVVRRLRPGLTVWGAEPTGAADAARSKASGDYQPEPHPDTIADGLRASLAEGTTWPLVRDLVDEILLVEDADIIRAMRLLWERAKLPVEPSGATAFAALLTHADRTGPGRVGVILSGGNADLDRLPWRTS